QRRPCRRRGGGQGLCDRRPRLRGLPVITLGQRRFTGPFIAPLWSPPRAPGLFAVMVPGWRLLMFHAVHFGHAAALSAPELVRGNAKYGYWLTLAGTEWNLYVATCEMYESTEYEREAACGELLSLPATITRGQAHAQL